MVRTKVVKIGNSLGATFDRSIITEIFGWGEKTALEAKYDAQNKSVTFSEVRK